MSPGFKRAGVTPAQEERGVFKEWENGHHPVSGLCGLDYSPHPDYTCILGLG